MPNFSLSPSFGTRGISARAATLGRVGVYFPDPFLDYASVIMPRNNNDVLRWAEFIWLSNGTYRMAASRVVRYFLTRIEIDGVSDEEKERYQKYLNDDIGLLEFMSHMGDDWHAYGNAFVSIYIPFVRFLRCSKCGAEKPISRVNYEFRDFAFYSECRACNYKGEFKHVDRRTGDPEKVKLIRWSPHQIKIMYHPVSGDTDYYWEIPERFRAVIRKGLRFYLESTPWEIVEAIRDRKLLRFNTGTIFHMKEDTISGIHSAGWGVSRILSNFKLAYYIQILKRYHEALALDYIVPFRVLTPVARNSPQADPLIHSNLGSFGGRVMTMINQHRRDPATWHWLPFPVEYQSLGGEAKQLTGHELVDQALDEMLNAIGIPAEMYKGTITAQAAPTALRLFQQTWMHLVYGFNRFINWVIDTLSTNFHWDKAHGKLQPVTLADDLDRRNLLLQLMSGNLISKELAFRSIGADVKEEMERILKERQMEQELATKAEEELQQKQELQALVKQPAQAMAIMPAAARAQAALGGAGLPGQPQGPAGGAGMGAPMPMGGGASTPDEKMVQAEQIAAQLVTMPELQRKQMLTQIRKSDQTLHALVTAKMDQFRSQASSQGRAMVLAQAGQQQGMM